MIFVGFINPLEANYLLNKHMVKASVLHSEPPLKTDPFQCLVKYSPEVLKKKTKVLDASHPEKNTE